MLKQKDNSSNLVDEVAIISRQEIAKENLEGTKVGFRGKDYGEEIDTGMEGKNVQKAIGFELFRFFEFVLCDQCNQSVLYYRAGYDFIT